MQPGVRAGDRDRFVDLLRGGSILAVVVGHWLVADVRWRTEGLEETSALGEVPAMWPLTWFLVVIPLFFFVGGYANQRSWQGSCRRGESYATFVDRRAHRVLVPSAVYLAIVLPAGAVIDRLGGLGLRELGGLFLQPLWFLGAYLIVVAMTPWTLAAHRRLGAGAILVLLALVVLGDVGRFALGIPALGYVNVLVVWLLMHQIGYWYSEGIPRSVAAGLVLGGLGAAALLVWLGPYTATMVGVTDGPVGNMHPPTLAIAALGVAQIGGALLLRAPLTRWLQRPRAWHAVVVVNLTVVTIYLWHQAALALAARLVLPLGYPDPTPGTPAWWLARVGWLLVPAIVLAGIVALLGRAEQVAVPTPIRRGRGSALVAAAALVVLGLGYLSLAGSSVTQPWASGQSLGPVTASAVLGVGLLASGASAFALLRARLPAPSVPDMRSAQVRGDTGGR